jgi:hypothetical protein
MVNFVVRGCCFDLQSQCSAPVGVDTSVPNGARRSCCNRNSSRMRARACACGVAGFLDCVCRPTGIEPKQSLKPIERLLHKLKASSRSSSHAWHAKRQQIAAAVTDDARHKVAAGTHSNERFTAVPQGTGRVRSVVGGKAWKRRQPCGGKTVR